MNIRDWRDNKALYERGWRWVLTLPRGKSIGKVISKHKTYKRAEQAAGKRELMISRVDWRD